MSLLVMDIGGTYMRLALSDDGYTFRKDPQKIATAPFPALDDALTYYVQQENIAAESVTRILIARSDRNNWGITPAQIARALPKAHLTLINDFEANAAGLIRVDNDALLHIGGRKMAPDITFPRAVIGVGTGLGLAYITKEQHVQRSHGGHMRPACVTSGHIALFEELQAFKHTPSIPIYEDALSGRGLLHIYRILCARTHCDCAYADTHALLAAGHSDPLVQNALAIFHELFGIFAHQVVAFGYSYGGLYLTGGIIDRLFAHNLFDHQTFFHHFTQQTVPIVLEDVRSTPVFWVKDEFISLKGLLAY